MTNYAAQAAKLLRSIVYDYDRVDGGGSFSCSVYDTAWLSMVTKHTDDQELWLFPAAFNYILNCQEPEGGWPAYASEIDGIMNTMAALLALCQHRNAHHQLGELIHLGIDARISLAEEVLRQRLMKWDVGATMHVAYEILVPSLLAQLEGFEMSFDFPGKEHLLRAYAHKMSRFDPNDLYQEKPMSALHSLEAFIGRVDFDRLKHHTRLGSMMASPSSTAAYLQHSSVWDVAAENYLCHVVSEGEGKGGGGVPSAFPTSNFEMIWVVSTLLQGGFTPDELGNDQLGILVKHLETSFRLGDGLIGFAPHLVPDVDDTSLAIATLQILDRPAPIQPMIREFEAQDHFRTYIFEKDPSFTANCNVLTSLLSAGSQLDENMALIEKCIRFLRGSWWITDQKIGDKWNLSSHYPLMLMSRSLMRFLILWDQGEFSGLQEHSLLINDILIMLFQALIRTLQLQTQDGSWDEGQAESSAYSLLTLLCLRDLPMATPLRSEIDSAIKNGRKVITNSGIMSAHEYTWIEKVTYYLPTVHQAYILAALNAPMSNHSFSGRLIDTFPIPSARIHKFKNFYGKLPLFANTPQWLTEAALIEGYLWLPQLQIIRLEVFPRRQMEEDKYFEYIPFTWTASNILQRAYYRAGFLREMMIISFLNYQADEYMESVVGTLFRNRLNQARKLINGLFDETDSRGKCCIIRQPSGDDESGPKTHGSDADLGNEEQHRHAISTVKSEEVSAQDREVYETLRRFVEHSIYHSAVRSASDYDKDRVRQELRLFLLAHTDQLEDNEKLSSQGVLKSETAIFQHPESTFFDWIRSTSSNHTSCPYSFAVAICFLSNGKDFFLTSNEKYLGQAACRHLSTLCRMYNDFGSLARDGVETNLNCLNFPEFHEASSPESEGALKDKLFRLAKYERMCLELTVEELRPQTREEVSRFMRTFINVTDMYGQIYVEKDIASRMK